MTTIAPEASVEAIEESNPEVVGVSALLTTTMRSIEQTVKAMEETGLRDKAKNMIRGAPVTQAFADHIGVMAMPRRGPRQPTWPRNWCAPVADRE